MALQSSGAISISQIKTALGSSSNSLRTLSAAAGKSTPDAMSEFYGFSAFAPPSIINSGGGSYTGSGTAADPYVITQGGGAFSYDSGWIDPYFAGGPLEYMEYVDWNRNYYTGALPGSRVRIRVNEAVPTKAFIKFTAKSISGLSSTFDSFQAIVVGWVSGYWGVNGPTLNDTKSSSTRTRNVGYESDIYIAASHISEIYIYTDETYSDWEYYFYGGSYPTINSITYQLWFEKQ